MSNYDIAISFDRASRSYRGGETVSGTVTIRVNKDGSCNGIELSRYWLTHGRGNRARGPVIKETLCPAIELRSGEIKELPFSFTADLEPVTYHGHYINVDHYVKVAVDVPWAIDPKCEVDYLLTPGIIPGGRRFDRDKRAKGNGQKKKLGAGATIVVALILSLFVIPFLMLLPLLLVVFLIWLAYRWLIHSRVGKVELVVPHKVVVPGELWPIELQFSPRTALTVNAITVRIRGRERCVKGSGKHRSTRRHMLFEKTTTIDGEHKLTAGQPHTVKTTVQLPDTTAYSIDLSDNDIKWEALVRIDIPLFPDWTEKIKLEMVPFEFAQPADTPETKPVTTPAPTPLVSSATPLTPTAAPLSPTTAPMPPTAGIDDLVEIVGKLVKAGQFGDAREKLLATHADRLFSGTLVIDQVLATLESPGADGLAGGKTILGRLGGENHQVQIFTQKNRNEAIGALSVGDEWHGTVQIFKWDDLYNRPVLFEAT